MQVQDLEGSQYDLVVNNDDIKRALDYVGAAYLGYGFLIVQIKDGDYVEIYGSKFNVPYMELRVETIYKV